MTDDSEQDGSASSTSQHDEGSSSTARPRRVWTATLDALRATIRFLARAAMVVAGTLAVALLLPSRAVLRVRDSRGVRGAMRALIAGVRVIALASLFAALALGAGWLCFERIPPGIIGVKQVNFGGGGIVERDYDAGIAFSLRGYHAWHFVDRRTRVLSFAWESEGGERPILEVRTKDGNVAQVGVCVPWRVRPGEAHALVRDGLKTAYPLRTRATVEKVLLQELASLSTDELATTETRRAKVNEALPRLNALLAEYHVEAESILVSQVWFGAQYETKLQQKQLTHQDALLSEAGKLVDQQRQQVDLFKQDIDASEKAIRAEMDKRIEERFETGRAEIAAIRAESKFYAKTRRTAAQSELDKASAEGDRALAQAASVKETSTAERLDTKGGRLLLARQAAENLNIRHVTLNSNDPRVPSVLDLGELVRVLIGPGERSTP
jgi:regulator of protease activity HflC (stomatin/prohibitin superfamily)